MYFAKLLSCKGAGETQATTSARAILALRNVAKPNTTIPILIKALGDS